MTGRVRTPALVLRTRVFQEDDLIVDLLTRDAGRVAVLARSARKAPKRYGGAVEMGARVDLEVQLRPGRELQSLSRCEVVTPVRNVRGDLDRIGALAYMLELFRLGAREGAVDPALYGLATGIVDALEAGPAAPEAVLLWEVALLAHLGYALGADTIADEADLAPSGRAALHALWRGDTTAHLDARARASVRHALERLWHRAVGHSPRAGRFLDLTAASASPAPSPAPT